jgi:hypothetical protein
MQCLLQANRSLPRNVLSYVPSIKVRGFVRMLPANKVSSRSDISMQTLPTPYRTENRHDFRESGRRDF